MNFSDSDNPIQNINAFALHVLPDWVTADSTLTALMPSRRGMSAATRAFIEACPLAVWLD
ncbi:hypothetical protein [Archangium primigenium]|uniref:hypothetical protein n=1 Tax=[Archangium] primigenium TaxID=2792470 RepID=UPI00195AE655|nr:hypothetical protein [Archangium primigenium]MBM7113685.1 hypothetical protein [Archangium primigenium]